MEDALQGHLELLDDHLFAAQDTTLVNQREQIVLSRR